jgi:hypothetical protein
MTTFADLKARMIEARKARNERETLALSTMVGNLTSNAKLVDGVKVVSDEDVTVYLKKSVKNLQESLAIKETEDGRWELNFIESFLPKQLSEEQLREIWTSINAANIGQFMGHLKSNFLGQYDGKLASKVAQDKSKE